MGLGMIKQLFDGAAAEVGAVATVSGRVSAYVASLFILKPVKYWNGTSWRVAPAKRWNGSRWVRI